MVKQDAPNGRCQCLSPQRCPSYFMPLQGDSPRSTSGTDPGTFQTTVSALKLEAYEILCMPCKNGISFTYGPSALLNIESEVVQSCLTLYNPVDYSLEFSRQEYWSGLPFPSPGDLPDPGIEPGSPALQADALTSEPPGKPLDFQNQLF